MICWLFLSDVEIVFKNLRIYFIYQFIYFCDAGIEPRTTYILGRLFTTNIYNDTYPRPSFSIYYLIISYIYILITFTPTSPFLIFLSLVLNPFFP